MYVYHSSQDSPSHAAVGRETPVLVVLVAAASVDDITGKLVGAAQQRWKWQESLEALDRGHHTLQDLPLAEASTLIRHREPGLICCCPIYCLSHISFFCSLPMGGPVRKSTRRVVGSQHFLEWCFCGFCT